MKSVFKKIREKKGQSATEYMLVLAVIVIGLVSAAQLFVPQFGQAVQQLSQKVISMMGE